MPNHAFISIPLDIPDVRVLQTELTKAGELILTIKSTLTSTPCRRCGRTITESHGVDEPRLLRHLPAVIVQGRYDVICPTASAWRLHQAWPQARLQIVDAAGHSAFEPGIQAALITATDQFRDQQHFRLSESGQLS